MEKSTQDLFRRTFDEPEPPPRVRESLARFFGPADTVVTRQAPAEVPPCDMTANDKAFVVEVVRLWLTLADTALNLFHLLVLIEAKKPEAAKRGIREIDLLLPHLSKIEEVTDLRSIRTTLASIGPLSDETKQQALQALNAILDTMQPFEGIVNAVTKYVAKLLHAEESVHKALDAIEDYQFARDFQAELAALGRSR